MRVLLCTRQGWAVGEGCCGGKQRIAAKRTATYGNRLDSVGAVSDIVKKCNKMLAYALSFVIKRHLLPEGEDFDCGNVVYAKGVYAVPFRGIGTATPRNDIMIRKTFIMALPRDTLDFAYGYARYDIFLRFAEVNRLKVGKPTANR